MAPRDVLDNDPGLLRDHPASGDALNANAYTLELFHLADQEAGPAAVEDIPNLSAVLNALRAEDSETDSLTLSSGDAYIPGIFFESSTAPFGVPGVADMIVQNLLGVEAIAFGNHEFDQGTDLIRQLVTGEEIDGYGGTAFPYLSSNLTFGNDPNLADLVVGGGQSPQPGTISSSTVIETASGERIGIVGATTPTLADISSPGNTQVISPYSGNPTPEDLAALAAVIQAEVDTLLQSDPNLNKVVLLSHMQQIGIEFDLAGRLQGVDIIVAGGSNTRLLDEEDIPRDGEVAQGGYPTFLTNADGAPVAVVNTDGNYKYLGRLVIDFDENGEIIPESYDPTISGAYATDDAGVARLGAEGLADPGIVALIDEIRDVIVASDGNYFGLTDVFLNGVREDVRQQETNLGNLTADANLWAARQVDDEVLVSIKNGGGIRAEIGDVTTLPGDVEPSRLPPSSNPVSGRPEGGISENAIRGALSFNNELSVVSLTAAELAAVLEHGVAASDGGASTPGQFPQIAGMRFSFDVSRPAGGRIVNAGIYDDNGTLVAEIVRNGEVVENEGTLFKTVTLSFLADGGDGYPLAGIPSERRVDLVDEEAPATGAATFAPDFSEQDALAEYLDAFHRETPYANADAPFAEDTRIQNLAFREDAVFEEEAVSDPVINEFVFNHTGTDTNEFVEVLGEPGQDLSGFSLIQIEGDGSGAGTIDSVTPLGSADEAGFATTSFLSNTFENGSVTLKLVEGFTGQVGQDLDADNDGVLDVAPWQRVADEVAVTDGGAGDVAYADTALSPPLPGGSTTVGGASRIPDGEDTGAPSDWIRNDFNTVPGQGGAPAAGIAYNTPSESNRVGGGQPPVDPNVVSIMEIQGASHLSALNGQAVATAGVVTAAAGNGFYLQDAEGDGDLATSDGIFVFTGGAPEVTAGDAVDVSGVVSEYTPGGASSRNLSITQIGGNPDVTVTSTGNPLPSPVLLGEGGRVPPTGLIDDDAFNSFDANDDPADFFESLEGMLATAADPLAVAATNSYGEVFTVVDGGEGNNRLSERSSLPISPENYAPEKVQLQFGSGNPLNALEAPQVNVGAQFDDVTGIVSFSFGGYELLVTEMTTVIDPGTLAGSVTNIQGGSDVMTVATYNVLNLDPNDGDGDADIADGRFDTIAQHIVSNLGQPDVVALQEVQDNSGSANDGVVSADGTLQTLVDAIAAAGGPTYAYIDNTFIGNNLSGGQPGANIRTAYLYNPERVDLLEGSVRTIGGQEPGEAFDGARLPLVADFRFNEETVTLVNNHFSSKGGSAPIFGTEQPFELRQDDPSVNGSVDERLAQAGAVKQFVDSALAESDDARVVVLGDLNEFEFNPPIELLSESLVNLVETLPEEERYSYTFQGNAQVLDHILVSPTLADNADFEFVGVNVEFAETPERGSDHDPAIAVLFIPGAGEPPVEFNVVAGTDSNDRLEGTEEADMFLFGAGNDQASGFGGGDMFVFGDSLSNGRREVKQIRDYNPDAGDAIDLGGNPISGVRETPNMVTLLAGEDGDQIMVRDVSSLDQIIFVEEPLIA